MCYEKSRHPRFIHPDADAVARHPRLAYFKLRITNAVSIADADFVVRKSFDGEVLSELAVDEVVTSEKAFPVVIGLHLIDKDGSLLPTVTGEIALPVANDVELAHHSPAFHRRLPYPGTHSLPAPRNVARKTDIYREQSRHAYLIDIQELVGILSWITSDAPVQRHLRGGFLRSHDLLVPD